MTASASGGAWTTRRMLAWMAEDFAERGIETPRLDAEVLLAEALGIARVKLYLDMERPLAGDELVAVRELVRRRRNHEPIAYILGQREFYSRSFKVDGRALIPRPDTELLVDEALSRLPKAGVAYVLDLCTGSGCVGLTIAAERPQLRVDLTDASADALAVARSNAVHLGVEDRAAFLHGDLWECVPHRPGGYSVIVANPPYVCAVEYQGLARDITEHEPRSALVAGEDGLSFYRRIAERARDFLASDGYLLLEVGQGQAKAVVGLFDAAGFAHAQTHLDLGGIARVVAASCVAPSGVGCEVPETVLD